MNSFPVIDISPLVKPGKSRDSHPHNSIEQPPDEDASIESVINQISRACETFGFFAVTNHGVDDDAIDSAWGESTEFFDSNRGVKNSVSMTEDYPYGYENCESLGTDRVTGTGQVPPCVDSKETFSIGPRDSDKSGMPSRKWPTGASSAFAPSLARYFSVMEDLASVLFRGLALALRMDSNYFLADGRFDDGHQCALRILNYPPLEYNEEEESEKEDNRRIRAGEHTDYGAVTVLKSGGPGLQLRLSSRRANGAGVDDDGTWMDVPYLADAFIVNLGDLMQRWTNVSTFVMECCCVAFCQLGYMHNSQSPFVGSFVYLLIYCRTDGGARCTGWLRSRTMTARIKTITTLREWFAARGGNRSPSSST